MSKKFATSGSPAVGVVKRFSWSNADQNIVAGMIAGQHMNPDQGGAEVDRGQQGQGQQMAR